MPFLWIEQSEGWAVMPLGVAAVSLGDDADAPAPPASGAAACGPVLVRVSAAGAKWVLLSPPRGDVRLNGEPTAGIRILEHGDEIRVARSQMFFSAEHRARVEPLAAGSALVSCGRCAGKIETGSPTVRCPNCGVWHHQSADRNCWTYAAACSACDYDTKLDTEFHWTPETL